ncbi:hypothetical protein F4780DRAFT_483120 [Xylariomycetidae sp. FL0641]|nr:hypothetical protein F4780DRAFT_483120 [Xylariomycetidae sp. FL0641]
MHRLGQGLCCIFMGRRKKFQVFLYDTSSDRAFLLPRPVTMKTWISPAPISFPQIVFYYLSHMARRPKSVSGTVRSASLHHVPGLRIAGIVLEACQEECVHTCCAGCLPPAKGRANKHLSCTCCNCTRRLVSRGLDLTTGFCLFCFHSTLMDGLRPGPTKVSSLLREFRPGWVVGREATEGVTAAVVTAQEAGTCLQWKDLCATK